MKAKEKSKHSLMSFFMLILGLILCVRLFMLTVVEHEKWKTFAEDMSVRTVYETAPRGDILDRNGKIIAGSRPVYSVNINRGGMDKEEVMETASSVISLLESMNEDVNTTTADISTTMEDTGYAAYVPITLAGDISYETANLIADRKYRGITIATDYVREYPNGAFASHIIGYLGRISVEEEEKYNEKGGYRRDSLIGKDGIEKKYESYLKGTDSIRRLQVDSTGDVIKSLGKEAAQKGKDLTLTIDSEIQKVTEDALQQAIEKAAHGGTFESKYGDYSMSYAKNAESGAAVALDVKTGEVISMASFPDFDPNDFAVCISQEKWESLRQKNPYDPMSPSPMYNIASMTAVQPGSTFKPVTAMAAMGCGLDENTYLYDDGAISLGGRTYGCYLWNDSRHTHGYVSLKEAVKVSCNYYFYDIAAGRDFASGKALNYDKPISNGVITDYAQAMGLGEKTGIEISESAGTVPSAKLKTEGIKNGLRNYLLAEEEVYFAKEILKDREQTRKIIEKIVNWTDKDLTLEEIIGKLIKEKCIKKDKIEELASVCKYTYFDQAEWTRGDTFNISIGQGDNAYTTLQMANYMSALANGGSKNDVTLIKRQIERKERENPPLDIADVNYIIDAMTGVTEDSGGSLYGAFSSFPYSVAAKTGTAQRAGKKNTEDERDYIRRNLHLIAPDVTMIQVEDEVQRLKKEYPDLYDKDSTALRRAVINESNGKITTEDIDRYKEAYDSFAWTVALAPADDPQIAVAVMMVQGKTSSNAAPVVREIIGKYGENSRWEKSF